MIYKVNDNEHFNLSLDIDPCEERGLQPAIININVILRNKMNGQYMREWFPSSSYGEALKCYRRYETMFFSKREDSE